MSNDAIVIRQTQYWVESVIVSLNFCPFACREVEHGTIHYQVSHDTGIEQALHSLISECERLDKNPAIETTLLIFTDAFSQFDDYLDMLELANEMLLAHGYEGIYQLASFHPDYCFDGESVHDAANFTNRSPYPMLHLIREASLEKALKNYPDPESIPEKNIELARSKGFDKMKEMLERCSNDKEHKDA